MLTIYSLLILIALWLGIVSFFLFKIIRHYNNLTRGVSSASLQTILESVLRETHDTKKDIALVTSRCDKIEQESHFHIQKIGLIRFNPFNDTGGDQSFILSLLDKQDSGVVISGLYSRTGTRWYAKKIHKRKSTEHELSNEEKRAILDAQGIT